MWVLKICDRWNRFPDEVEERSQSLVGHLEREQIVLDALKRYS
jgi:hypothetical protein